MYILILSPPPPPPSQVFDYITAIIRPKSDVCFNPDHFCFFSVFCHSHLGWGDARNNAHRLAGADRYQMFSEEEQHGGEVADNAARILPERPRETNAPPPAQDLNGDAQEPPPWHGEQGRKPGVAGYGYGDQTGQEVYRGGAEGGGAAYGESPPEAAARAAALGYGEEADTRRWEEDDRGEWLGEENDEWERQGVPRNDSRGGPQRAQQQQQQRQRLVEKQSLPGSRAEDGTDAEAASTFPMQRSHNRVTTSPPRRQRSPPPPPPPPGATDAPRVNGGGGVHAAHELAGEEDDDGEEEQEEEDAFEDDRAWGNVKAPLHRDQSGGRDGLLVNGARGAIKRSPAAAHGGSATTLQGPPTQSKLVQRVFGTRGRRGRGGGRGGGQAGRGGRDGGRGGGAGFQDEGDRGAEAESWAVQAELQGKLRELEEEVGVWSGVGQGGGGGGQSTCVAVHAALECVSWCTRSVEKVDSGSVSAPRGISPCCHLERRFLRFCAVLIGARACQTRH